MDYCLAFITEEKKRALRQRKSIDWGQTTVDIATYLDNAGSDAWKETFIPLIEGVMKDTGEQLNLSFGTQFNVQNIGALQWFDEYTMVFAQEITATTKRQIADMMQQGEMEGWSIKQFEDKLELMFKQWKDGSTNKDDWDWYDQRMPQYRRETIARTEVMRASNTGGFNLMRDAGIQKKEWLATADNRTRDSHMQAWHDYSGVKGAIIITQPFIVNGMHMMYPGDPAGGSEGINCRCTFIPHMESSEENTIPFSEE